MDNTNQINEIKESIEFFKTIGNENMVAFLESKL
jgi:hypothetical protein